MKPKCFGRYSEDEQGRTSVECDYCGQYEECVELSMARAVREHIIERDRELLEALNMGSKKVRLSFSTTRPSKGDAEFREDSGGGGRPLANSPDKEVRGSISKAKLYRPLNLLIEERPEVPWMPIYEARIHSSTSTVRK